MQKIRPFLWFQGNAEEAARFYVGLFRNAKLVETVRYGDAGPGKKGAVMLVRFELEGEEFFALNGNADFSFTPAISFLINCETQQEVDMFWDRLGDGGKPIQCGWITDRFGVTWQVVPSKLPAMLQDPDAARATRVMQAMMQMVKLDIATLQRAYDGA